MSEARDLAAALLAGTLGIAEHGEAVAVDTKWKRGYIDEEGAWRPRRIEDRDGPEIRPIRAPLPAWGYGFSFVGSELWLRPPVNLPIVGSARYERVPRAACEGGPYWRRVD